MGHRVPFSSLPIDQSDVAYDHAPDSTPRTSVPRGRTSQLLISDSAAFPGTTRSVWVHEPAVAPDGPLPVIVFQDGAGFLRPRGTVRTPSARSSGSHRASRRSRPTTRD